MTEGLSGVLRSISAALKTPVIVILLILMAATILALGSLVIELFTHRKTLAARRTKILTDISSTDHNRRENHAVTLIKAEKTKYEGIVKLTDGIARLGPMFGLLGTLIPLGPGIIALGRGDTFTLSQSLLTAFDTTVAGLISAAAAFVISGVRKRWYAKHVAELESKAEDILNETES